jgi:imidazolonepropionase-like amidohydrolase
MGGWSHMTEGDHGATLAAQGWPVQRVPFLMPGLVDAHVHLFLDGGPTDQPTRSRAPEAKRRCAGRSGTPQRAPGLAVAASRWCATPATATASTTASATRRCSGSGLARGALRWAGHQARQALRRLHGQRRRRRDQHPRLGAALAATNDEIKLILTGIIDFDAGAVTDEPQFDVDAARLVVETRTAAAARCSRTAAASRVWRGRRRRHRRSSTASSWTARHLLRMRDRDLAWTPTFCPVHFQWAKPQAAGWSANTVGNLRRILDSHAEHVRLAHELGVTVLAGTDAGSMGVVHGQALAEEAQRLQEAGLPVDAVLRSATVAPRRHFGASQPLLTVGGPWEAVVLEASPFGSADVGRTLQRVAQVWLAPASNA